MPSLPEWLYISCPRKTALFPQLSHLSPSANFSSGPFSQACHFSPATSKANELLVLKLGPGHWESWVAQRDRSANQRNIPDCSFRNDTKGSGGQGACWPPHAAQGSKGDHSTRSWLELPALFADFLALSKRIRISHYPVHIFSRPLENTFANCYPCFQDPESSSFFFFNSKIVIYI